MSSNLHRPLIVLFALAALLACGWCAEMLARDSGQHQWVVVRSRHADLSGGSDQIVSDHASEEAAIEEASCRNKAERDLAIVYMTRLRPAVGGQKLKPTDKGLRGYTKNIRAAYDRARRASAYLQNHTGELTRSAFNDINGLIRDFNTQYDDAVSAGTAPADISRVPTVPADKYKGTLTEDPKEAAARARAEVVGTWQGVSVQGDSKLRLTARFAEDGTVTNTAENGRSGKGTWTRDGDTLTVVWSTGARVSWQITAKEISGSGTTSRGQPWSTSLRKP